MKEQYVGDINDYRKYALLRLLAREGDARIGVCWMLTPPDGRADGGKREYLQEPDRWTLEHDPSLFALMADVDRMPIGRRIPFLEAHECVPGATYFGAEVPQRRELREAYMTQAGEALAECDLVFFDPDNGLEVPTRGPGTAGSPKYVYYEEVRPFVNRAQSVLVYQHYRHEPRDRFIGNISNELRDRLGRDLVHVFRTPYVAFFMIAQPSHKHLLKVSLENLAQLQVIDGARRPKKEERS